MNNSTCPLCSGNDTTIIERINAKDLNDIYVLLHQVDIQYLFPQEELTFSRCENCGLKFFTPSVIGDEHFYRVLQKADLYYMEDKEEYDYAAKYIMPAHDILDVGCGKGAFSKKVNCNSFTGLELSASAKELAEQDGIKIINQTIQEHSLYNKEKYDVVCTFQVLEHVECNILYDFLQTMLHCVKQNGLLIISVPSDDSFVSRGENSALNLPPHHQTHWPDKTLKEIATIFDLEIVDLHHDTLSPRNRDEYLYLTINYRLTRRHRLLNKKLSVMQKVSFRLLNMLNSKLKVYMVDKIKPYRHSITAVYKKR